MKLRDLLSFESVVIQCHNVPDADAIASGWALYRFFQARGKQARLIYGGSQPIAKSNLVLLVDSLKIPIEHVQSLPIQPPLLLTVDCQAGERNVQPFSADTVAVIDHHTAAPGRLPPLSDVRPQYGACATVVWDLLLEEGVDPAEDEGLATALYYGLLMDTGRLQELRHPRDRDLRDALEFRVSKPLLTLLTNSNLSLQELSIAGAAMAHIESNREYRFGITEVAPCDPNVLGIISDAMIEVDTLDTCIAFCALEDGVKLSVRSCVRETRADELAGAISAGIGSGGGHMHKAGGFLATELLTRAWLSEHGSLPPGGIGEAACVLLQQRMLAYFRDQELIWPDSPSAPDLSADPVYEKKRLPIGYVRATDLYPVGTQVTLRMLEGDITLFIREDTIFMIGAEGEVYQNNEAYFLAHNDPTGEPYTIEGEYAPTAHVAVSAWSADRNMASRSLREYARACVPRQHSRVHAHPISRRTKVFVPWSDNYLLGLPGDFLAGRVENPKDLYIIHKDIMEKTYFQVDPESENQA